jgi:hypothetical protein
MLTIFTNSGQGSIQDKNIADHVAQNLANLLLIEQILPEAGEAFAK